QPDVVQRSHVHGVGRRSIWIAVRPELAAAHGGPALQQRAHDTERFDAVGRQPLLASKIHLQAPPTRVLAGLGLSLVSHDAEARKAARACRFGSVPLLSIIHLSSAGTARPTCP